MPDDEGLALHEAGLDGGRVGPLLEIGSYCGKSGVYLGAAAREWTTVLFTIDHHHGSEENQAGWEHHDPDVVDPRTGRMDTLPFFRRTIADAGLESVVVGGLGDSPTVGRPLGDTTRVPVHRRWPRRRRRPSRTTRPGPIPCGHGWVLAIHDVFERSRRRWSGPVPRLAACSRRRLQPDRRRPARSARSAGGRRRLDRDGHHERVLIAAGGCQVDDRTPLHPRLGTRVDVSNDVTHRGSTR